MKVSRSLPHTPGELERSELAWAKVQLRMAAVRHYVIRLKIAKNWGIEDSLNRTVRAFSSIKPPSLSALRRWKSAYERLGPHGLIGNMRGRCGRKSKAPRD